MPFVLTQILGIYAAVKFLPQLGPITPSRLNDFSFWDLVFFAALIAGFTILIKRFKSAASTFFRVFLTLIIFSGTQAIASIWIGNLPSIFMAAFFILIFLFFNNVFWQDLIMIMTFAGIGAVIGLSFTPETVIILLVALSFYDIIAVYKTKHMVALAENMIKSRAIFGFVIPIAPSGFGEKMVRVVPGEQFMILGSGDVILPLLLSSSLVRVSLTASIIVAAFSAAGLFLMHLIFINQKIRRPMAALPPIALTAILGYLVASLV